MHFRTSLLTIATALTAAYAGAQAPLPAPSPTPSPSTAAPAPAATAVVPAAVPVEATPPAQAPCDPAKGDVCVNAERLRRNEKDHLSWEGFVDLQFGDGRIQAEQLDLYTEPKPDGTTSRRVEATGNVVFLRGQERLSGQSLKMDLTTGRGTFQNAIGYAEPGVFVEAKSIERVDAHTYKIHGGKFTSCCQPNPRWDFSASSATLKVDKKITAKNVVFRAKAVPAFYLPYFVYPIEQDQRSTGFLFPHFGQSSIKGYNIGTGFFWAMNRSADQTFYLDHFTKYGYGFGHELRYALPSPSRGTFRTFFERLDTGGWEHEFNWTAVQLLPGRIRANLQVNDVSNVAFQEQVQDSLDYASQRTRRSALSLQRAFGRHNVSLQADSTDSFFPQLDGTYEEVTQRHLPLLKVAGTAQKNRATGLVFSYESRAEKIENTDPGGSSKYSRFDANPRLSRPLSLSFLQVTPELQVRGTNYSKTDVAGAGTTGPSITRKYVEANVDMRGPTFSKVFDAKGNFYSERYKHVIGPEVTFTRRSGIDPDDFQTYPKLDGHDYLVDTSEVRYGIVQRFYAKRPGRGGKLDAIEFFNWRVSQTYYLDTDASRYDPNYNFENLILAGGVGEAVRYSPLRSQMRFRPNDFISANFTLQYDVNAKQLRNFDLSTGFEYPTFRFDAGWSRGNQVNVDPARRRRTYDTLRGSTRWAIVPGRLAMEGRADYNILDKKLLRVSGVLRYDIQCVGLLVEYIRSEYGARVGERQFRFSVELANIGSMGNFMGQKPGSSGFR